jgi:hypothetical protein
MNLSDSFLNEIIRLSFNNLTFLEILSEHFKYQYVPDNMIGLKKIIKSLISYYRNNNKIPTFGQISQLHNTDNEVQNSIADIRSSNVLDFNSATQQLEEFIKKVRFINLHHEVKELYERGEEEKAINYNLKESEDIINFSLSNNTDYFTKVFKDFESNIQEKNIKDDQSKFKDKLPIGIPNFDEVTYGGIDLKETALFVARSGTGKSTILKWIGQYATRLNYNMLHIQLEGSKQEAMDKYTQAWTALDYIDIKNGDIPGEKYEKLIKIVSRMIAHNREIYIYSFEMFDEATCRDVRDLAIKYQKERGFMPDCILIDSIDLLHPGDGIKYGADTQSIKMKKENSARKLKNISNELNTRMITVDQANNIPKEYWNNPDWVMDRNNLSGAKNLINSFSYFVTLNQTEDEENNEIMRLFYDKLRYYKTKNKVDKIVTNYSKGRFINLSKTIELQNKIDQPKKIKAKTVKNAK